MSCTTLTDHIPIELNCFLVSSSALLNLEPGISTNCSYAYSEKHSRFLVFTQRSCL